MDKFSTEYWEKRGDDIGRRLARSRRRKFKRALIKYKKDGSPGCLHHSLMVKN